MVYSPNKYRETEGVKERDRFFKNGNKMANEQWIKKTFKTTALFFII